MGELTCQPMGVPKIEKMILYRVRLKGCVNGRVKSVFVSDLFTIGHNQTWRKPII